MSSSHGRLTVVKVATKDISPFCSTSTFEVNPDVHDRTGYGAVWAGNTGGLLRGTFSASGFYDNTVTVGPRIVLLPLWGTNAAMIRQLEGTGVGKPQEAFTAVVGKYTETNPVDDIVRWSCEFTVDGLVTTTPQ
jgi:hypothetical protein